LSLCRVEDKRLPLSLCENFEIMHENLSLILLSLKRLHNQMNKGILERHWEGVSFMRIFCVNVNKCYYMAQCCYRKVMNCCSECFEFNIVPEVVCLQAHPQNQSIILQVANAWLKVLHSYNQTTSYNHWFNKTLNKSKLSGTNINEKLHQASD